MADKNARRAIRLTEVAWRQLDVIAEGMGAMSSSDAVRFLIRQWKASHPKGSQHQIDDVDVGKPSERLTLRISERRREGGLMSIPGIWKSLSYDGRPATAALLSIGVDRRRAAVARTRSSD